MKKYLFLTTLIKLSVAVVAAPIPATAQTPSYIPPPNWDAPQNTLGRAELIPSSAPTGSVNTPRGLTSPADPVAAIP